MVLALLACVADPVGPGPDSGGAAPVDVREWLYGDVVVPDEGAIVGMIQVDHDGDPLTTDGWFTPYAAFWTALPTRTQPWSDPFEGLGDCGVWDEPPTAEGDYVPASAGTVFLDAGLGEPFPLVPVDGVYQGWTFQDAGWGPPEHGAVFAVAAAGDEYPAFDWDPGMALPLAGMQVTSPVESEGPTALADAFDLAWAGEDPHAVVVIDVSVGAQQGVYCEVPDTGAFTIPQDLVDGFAGERITLTVTRRLDRYEAIEPGRFVLLRTQSDNRLRLDLGD